MIGTQFRGDETSDCRAAAELSRRSVLSKEAEKDERNSAGEWISNRLIMSN